MTIDTVDLFVPVLEPGAVGAHTLALRDLLRERGLDAEIYAEEARGPWAAEARPLPAPAPRSGSRARRAGHLAYYQLAIGSPVADYVAGLGVRTVVGYHNVTPPGFFEGWDPAVARALARGRAQLAALAPRSELAVGDSGYNARECAAAGFPRVGAAPVLGIGTSTDAGPDPEVLDDVRSTKRGADWLFVGRVAPNKAVHDLVRALAMARRVQDPHARLFVVGGDVPGGYGAAVRDLVARLGLAGAVTFTGAVSPARLAAYYDACDVFVCCSEHEGFCVPVVESWRAGIPVIAYAAGAVPETVGGAGLVLARKDPTAVAAAVARMTSDASLRERLVAAGRARAARFTGAAAAAAHWRALAGVLAR